MIQFLILLICAIYMVRTITIVICLAIASKRLNKRINLIIDSLPDERSAQDLDIEINKIEWYLDTERMMRDFIYPFKTINVETWINPELISLLYDHYKIK